MPLSKRLAAEFLGTLWLVLGGCSAVLAVPSRTTASPSRASRLRSARRCWRWPSRSQEELAPVGRTGSSAASAASAPASKGRPP